MADYACVLPGTERVGPRTVGFRADDGDALLSHLPGADPAGDHPGGLSDREPMDDAERRRLRTLMGHFATGVTVVAARHGPLLAGMTANAIATISIDPPILMASIARQGGDACRNRRQPRVRRQRPGR